MGDSTNNISSLMYRIEQLEQEREELRKDIEQLCMQQAGTGYIGIITRIQAQRTAGLEQEIETLKQKLVACTRDNHTLQEELSEVYRIKSHFADLYKSELEKNSEAEKQIKFFQSRVAAAFSDRDRALMEVERANEKEKAMSDKLNELQNRIEEITADRLEEAKLCTELQRNLGESKAEIAKLEQVVEKFYQIRRAALGVLDREPDEDKASCLLQDPAHMWSFSEMEDYRTQMVSMQEELTASRDFVEKLHERLEETRASEDHLMQCVNTLEAKLKHSEDIKKNEINLLRIFQVQKRSDILNLIEEERKWLESMAADIEAHVKGQVMNRWVNLDSLKLNEERQSMRLEQSESIILNENTEHAEKNVSGSMHIGSEGQWNTDDDRKALAQALQEKVEALLLLSQQEERHLLEKNTNVALEEKMKELQQKLLQVTNEKVSALMELARLRQECQHLEEHRRSEDGIEGSSKELTSCHVEKTSYPLFLVITSRSTSFINYIMIIKSKCLNHLQVVEEASFQEAHIKFHMLHHQMFQGIYPFNFKTLQIFKSKRDSTSNYESSIIIIYSYMKEAASSYTLPFVNYHPEKIIMYPTRRRNITKSCK